ncbi:MAG TPA: two-component regulator propeller domain-containing protein, partial [Bacteroidales bacterium]
MKHSLIIVFLLILGKGYAQDNIERFKRLTTLQGLSQSWTRCIYQDDIGYMWFGTVDGLNRYDGHNFKIYTPKAKGKFTLGSMVINQILKKNKNELWICTNNGIYSYNRLTDDF